MFSCIASFCMAVEKLPAQSSALGSRSGYDIITEMVETSLNSVNIYLDVFKPIRPMKGLVSFSQHMEQGWGSLQS